MERDMIYCLIFNYAVSQLEQLYFEILECVFLIKFFLPSSAILLVLFNLITFSYPFRCDLNVYITKETAFVEIPYGKIHKFC